MKSLFEQEAERIRGLNKFKKEDDMHWLAQALAFGFGVLVAVAVFLFVGIPTSAYFIFAHGFVLSKMWLWFLVPLGLPAISLWHAAGIVALIRLCTYHVDFTKDEKNPRPWKDIIIHFLGASLIPWASLLFAYIIHRLM